MKTTSAISLTMALMLSLLLTPFAQADAYASQAPAPAYVELDATQLDQLVAPIALDPDSLVAQILTASTYPDQVSAADTWLNQNMNLHPDQRAAAANNMSWDPAVKGLIEFPSELDMLTKNAAWTAQLGNAYYNQPGDVMNAIQAMRLQAQQSNVLVTTAQQRVVVEAGVIAIVPVDPAVIYVPYYNPWRIWGSLFVAYPGFEVLPPPVGVVWGTGLAFDPGVAVGVYAGYGWGFGAWAPAWDGGTVMYGGNTYISNSTTVINHGYFGGHDRGVFDHDGRGVPRGYHACAHAGAARDRAASARAHGGRPGYGKPSAGRPVAHGTVGGHPPYGNRGSANHGSANRGTQTANRGSANRGSANRGSANRGYTNRSSANHRTTAANRGSSTTNRGGLSNRSTSAASRGASANRGISASNRGASNNRGTSAANRGASANRGMSAANRGGSANRGASMNRGSSPGHASSMANRGGVPANHGSANHGGSSMASRGGSPSAGHSGGGAAGGHASGGGHGHGR